MRLFIALLLNALLLLLAGGWLRREWGRSPPSLRRWLLPALAARLLLTGLSARWPSPDATYLSYWARALTAELWRAAHPPAAGALLLSPAVRAGGAVLSQYELSNTVFFIKIVSLLNYASLGAPWLNALYLSLGCFVSCWGLGRTWARVFPATPPGAALVAFVLWPSVLWWTAGLTKETVLLGAEAGLVALVLPWLYPAASALAPAPAPGPRLARLLGAALLAALAVRMRYFFALPLLGALLTVAAGRGLMGRGGGPGGRGTPAGRSLALLLGGGALGWWGVSELLPPGFLVQHLYEQFQHGVATSAGRPHLDLPGLAPTGASLLAHAPAAVGQVLARPWLGESAQLLYIAAALENLLLLSLLALAAYALARARPGRLPLPLTLALLAYCLLLASFIGLSTPNLGTLHRYRAALLPWLLLLLLQNDYAARLLRRLGLCG